MPSSLCALLEIDIPIIQAPTGSIAGPELAAAVSAAGGLGSLGLTWTEQTDAVEAVQAVRAATDRPFLVNYALSFEPKTLRTVLAAGAPIVSFSWGDATSHIPIVHAAGAKAGVQIGSGGGALRALESGADFLICQGHEAGGHVQSTTPVEQLLAEVLRIAGGRIPVVATGGMTDGRDIARIIAMGAAGAMLGTRFVATRESRAHDLYKGLLVSARGDPTSLTVCFDGGWPHAPHRVLRNSTLNAWESAGCPPPKSRPGEREIVGRASDGSPVLRYDDTAPRVGMAGDAEAMALYAGTGAGRIVDLPAAGDLLTRLWRDARS